MTYVVTGQRDAPTVVLANSLGSTWKMWDANLADLEQHFRVVRFDTRGHGRSPVPPGPYTIDDLADDLVAQLSHIANSVANGKLLVVPDAAHLAAADRPDLVTPAVTAHLLEDHA